MEGILDLVELYATKYSIAPDLLWGIVMTESNGRPYAARFEKDYKYPLDVQLNATRNGISFDTEMMFQMTSWGLCQVMGGVARELGFEGPMQMLCEAEVGLKFGTLKLLRLVQKYGVQKDVISAYNQGWPKKDQAGNYSNADYVSKVLANMAKFSSK